MTIDSLPDDPFKLFDLWFAEAEAGELNDPNAMSLATAGADGRPSTRVVLLKEHDDRGFIFYSNEESRKGRELATNPFVHLNFHWKSLRRQVRIDGKVERVAGSDADAYFASRPRASQIGAWASEQSRPLRDRETLESRVAAFAARFDGRPVPRPPHWGGWRVVPERIEFWVDRRDRLHERYIYSRTTDGWSIGMIYP